MVGMAEIELHLDQWPAAVCVPPEGSVTDTQLEEYLCRHLEEVRARGGAYVTVVDLRLNSGITPRQRRMIADHIRDNDSPSSMCVGSAFVFESRALAAMLTGIFWLKKPSYPTQVFRSLSEAVAWAQEIAGAASAANA